MAKVTDADRELAKAEGLTIQTAIARRLEREAKEAEQSQLRP